MNYCGYCNRSFDVPRKELNRNNGKYCSLSCAAKAGNKIKKKKFYLKLKDEKNFTLKIDSSVGNYIAGLVDGEGSFQVTLLNSKRISAQFKVEMSIGDKDILDWLKIQLNAGNTYLLPKRNANCKEAYRFVVRDFTSLVTKIIPLFEEFPLHGKKAQDFFRFKFIIISYINEMLKETPDLSFIKEEVNRLNKHYNSIDCVDEMLDGNYIAGLTDGEGSFAVKVTKDDEMKCGYRIKPTFSIQLTEKDVELLKLVRNTLHCGTVRVDKTRVMADYSVQSINNLLTHIVPFFDKYLLRAKKRNDFVRFKKILELCEAKEHLSLEGVKKIIAIRKQMNCGGAPNRKTI